MKRPKKFNYFTQPEGERREKELANSHSEMEKIYGLAKETTCLNVKNAAQK